VYNDNIDIISHNKKMDMRIRDIDPVLSKRFKALCLLEEKTLGQYLTELMEREIEEKGLSGKGEKQRSRLA